MVVHFSVGLFHNLNSRGAQHSPSLGPSIRFSYRLLEYAI